MSRWVYGFCSAGIRPMTEQELASLEEAKHAACRKLTGLILLTIFLGAACLFAIPVFADVPKVMFPTFLAFLVAFLYAFSLMSKQEALHLLFRRGLRVRMVEMFERTQVPDRLRSEVARKWQCLEPDEDPSQGFHSVKRFWLEDEKIVQAISPETTFESLDRDCVMILVGGRPVNKVIDLPIVSIGETASEL